MHGGRAPDAGPSLGGDDGIRHPLLCLIVGLTLLTVALAVVATGPERLSLDRALGWDDNLSGIDWASAVLAAAIVISVVTTTLGRGRADTGEMGA